jgi:vacuolar-type H+-ATPase subunit H
MTTTTQSPVQDIARSEEGAKRRTGEAKKLSTQEVEAFRVEESMRAEEKESTLMKEAEEELKREEKKLEETLKKRVEGVKAEKEKLHARVQKNESGIVHWLVEQFLFLEP